MSIKVLYHRRGETRRGETRIEICMAAPAAARDAQKNQKNILGIPYRVLYRYTTDGQRYTRSDLKERRVRLPSCRYNRAALGRMVSGTNYFKLFDWMANEQVGLLMCADNEQCCGGCCIEGECIDTYRSCQYSFDVCKDHSCRGEENCVAYTPLNCPGCEPLPLCQITN
ncbi:hypothetical protein MSG28_005345 [Choristoneura fumiferana]|uniref:Uncharacterized protein n=1 Tax=Choristoneura fumiferana TaxID=7141 RepID=A0ACC0JQW1_CHOFU|nr:hypothetical protein MSG28_005345 [Choristoneura fumiferana]